jgi:hypothetical protein
MRYPRAVLPYGKPGYIRTMRPSGSRYLAVLRRRPWVAALLTAVPVAGAAAVVLTAVLSRPGPAPVPVRVRSWRADIAYLARELPHKHIDGLTGASRATWDATAAHLEAEVPQLTDGQVIAGMLRLIALLRDDETFLQLSWRRIYPFHAVWLGRGLYLTAVPAARHDLLGARLEAIDGHPLSAVIARLQPEIDYLPQDSATFTVRTVSGQRENVTLAAVFDQATLSALRFARVPRTLAQRNDTSPYWMRVFPGRRAVYLKYNQCLDSNGFQRLALKAVAILRHRPTYRLIVDLRGNGGGSDAPFQTLINGIRADPAINRPGRLFGLIDGETDSSAARDASSLGRLTNALLLGQEVEDPVDEFGNDDGLLTLPHSHLAVTYTTKVLNAATARLAPPDIVITPTISQVLAGTDPVLDRALSYPLPSRAGR